MESPKASNRLIWFIKHKLRLFLDNYEISFYYFKWRHPDTVINDDTEIVIEAAPSSGNSFAVQAFKIAQNREVRIAHHQHLPFQVIKACQKEIPCLVIIRNPLDVLSSYLSRFYLNPGSLEAILWGNLILNYWIRFYNTIFPYKDKFFLCMFDEVTKNYGEVINKLNEFYGTNFKIPNETHYEEAWKILNMRVKPDKNRNIFKQSLKKWISNEKRFMKPLKEALKLYEKYVNYKKNNCLF